MVRPFPAPIKRANAAVTLSCLTRERQTGQSHRLQEHHSQRELARGDAATDRREGDPSRHLRPSQQRHHGGCDVNGHAVFDQEWQGVAVMAMAPPSVLMPKMIGEWFQNACAWRLQRAGFGPRVATAVVEGQSEARCVSWKEIHEEEAITNPSEVALMIGQIRPYDGLGELELL